MALPLVAVCAPRLPAGRIIDWPCGAVAAQETYLGGLRRAGVRPALLSWPDPDPPADIIEPFAGVVLLGGGDIDPARYGAEPHRAVYGVDRARDAFEVAVVRAALGAGKPLFAVCRGMQVLVVAMGGTLVQHLPERDGGIAHGRPVGEGAPAVHEVAIAPDSRLAAALGGAPLLSGCISIHHQAAATVPDALVVTARSSDGVIEAVETPKDGGAWVLGVQWHPERNAATDAGQQALFDAFGAALRVGAPAG